MKYFQRMMRNNFIMFLFLIVVNLLSAQQINYPSDIIHPVLYGTSPPLMDIINNAPPEQRNNEPGGEALSHEITETAVPREPLLNYDPVLQNQYGQIRSIASYANFDGVNNLGNVLPPDPNGDVGPNHYFQTVNTQFAIYDKSGTILMGPYSIDSLWVGFSGPWTTMSKSDPIVLYDHLADRWFVSIIYYDSNTWDFYELIAISQGSDPLGAYYRYAYHFNDYAPDYPKFGVWPDGYYMSANKFPDPYTFTGMAAYVFERDSMLVGNEARLISFTSFTDNTAGKGLLPSDLDGESPPQNSPNYFTYIVDGETQGGSDRLGVFELHVDWLNANNSTFTGPSILTPEAFNRMCTNGRNCVPQLDSQEGLDLMGDRLMYRLQYRNFGSYQTMVVCHSVDAGNSRAGIRWYELRNNGTEWGIYQQGTYAPSDGLHRWMGSIAMDQRGNIALGYTASSEYEYPSIRITGRHSGDPLGQMTVDEKIIIAGTGSQLHPLNRWGDYSMMSVDPVDGETFWFTGEYYQTTSSADWHTRIAAFSLLGVVLANRHNGDSNSNLGGTLSLDNLVNDDFDYFNVVSDSNPVPVKTGDQYDVRTNDPTLQGEKHLNWNENSADHLLEKSNFEMTNELVTLGLNANFDFQDPFTITTSIPQGDVVELHDPWYLQNPNDPPQDWIQPDTFLPLSDQDDGHGHVQVFLNQGQIGNPNSTDPIYSLRAPKYYATTDAIYEFSQWTGTNGEVEFDASGAYTTTARQTDVVFLTAGATVTAEYTNLLANPDNQGILTISEPLDIPAGAQYVVAPEFGFRVQNGTSLNLNGTPENPILIKVNENPRQPVIPWQGIQVSNGSVDLQNVVIKNAVTGLDAYVYPQEKITLRNCTFINNNHGIIVHGEAYNNNDVVIDNTIFKDQTQTAVTVGASNERYTRYNIKYCLFHNNGQNIVRLGGNLFSTGNIMNQDPLFVDAAHDDYHLQASSPGINRGNPDVQYNDPDGTRSDIGAYYFDAVPTAPTNLTLTGNYGDAPYLSWTASTDNDIQRYYIYRKQNSGGSYTTIGNTAGTHFTDTDIIIGPPMATWYYYVKAKDNVNQYSQPSNTVSTVGMLKQLVQTLLPTEYALGNNTPNPFNPTTAIPFDLPEDSDVQLVVYNLQGREVARLTDGNLTAGSYRVRWDGKTITGTAVPSGVYLCVFSANALNSDDHFTAHRKLVLLK